MIKENRYTMIILIFSMLIILFNQLNNTGLLALGNFMYAPFIGIILTFILYKYKGYNTYLNTNKDKLKEIIAFFMILAYSISPVLALKVFKYTPAENITYISLFYMFIFTLVIISKSINTENKYKLFLTYSLIGNSAILIVNLIVNINQITYVDFTTILAVDRGIRANFHMSHPNTAAMYILIEILLIYLIFMKNKKKKLIPLASIGVLSIFMISTGSRTANLCILMFITLQFYTNIIKNLNKYIKMSVIMFTITIIFILIFYKIDFVGIISETSGRDRAFMNNIEAIKIYGDMFFGIAPTSIMILNEYCFLDFADNWYIVQLIQFGFVGLFIMIYTLMLILVRFIKNKNMICFNLVLVLLLYSTAERVLFVPGVTLSYMIWALIFTNLNRKNYY
ncbi:hypothetical protein ACQPUZ_07580 [Clostridium tertium]